MDISDKEPEPSLDSLPIELLNIIGINLDLEHNLNLALITKQMVAMFGKEKINRWVKALRGPDEISWENAIQNLDIHIIQYYIKKDYRVEWYAVQFAMKVGDPYIFKLIFQHYINQLDYWPPTYKTDQMYYSTYMEIYNMALQTSNFEIINYLRHDGIRYVIDVSILYGELKQAKTMLIQLKHIYDKNVPNEVLHNLFNYLHRHKYIHIKHYVDITHTLSEVGATDIPTLLFLAILDLDPQLVAFLLNTYRVDTNTLNMALSIMSKLDITRTAPYILNLVKILELLVKYGANDKNALFETLEGINTHYSMINEEIGEIPQLLILCLNKGLITIKDISDLARDNDKILYKLYFML